MTTSSRYQINTAFVVYELFDDDEAAVINLKSGAYYSLDAIGAELWTLFESGATTGEVVEEALRRYDGSLAAIIDAVNTFVAALEAEELISLVPISDPVSMARRDELPVPKVPFRAPVIERFTDMQELLLLDPIHEVGDAGWPHRGDDAAG